MGEGEVMGNGGKGFAARRRGGRNRFFLDLAVAPIAARNAAPIVRRLPSG